MYSFDTATARPVAQASVSERLAFLQRVYGWMTAALLMTAVGAGISIQTGLTERAFMFSNSFMGAILIMLAWMGMGWGLMKVRHMQGVNVIAFAAYSLFTGFVLSGIIFVAMLMARQLGQSSMTYVWQALGLTTVTFGGLTAYTFFTKRDFSFLAGMLTVATWGFLGVMLLSFFFQSTGFALLISFFGVVLFAGWILFDTQRIMREYPTNEHVAASFTIYLNFVNLFVNILRIILLLAGGGRRD